MAIRPRKSASKDEQDTFEKRPRRARGVFAAFVAAAVLIVVTALVTTIVVDAVHGRANLVVATVSGTSPKDDVVAKARAQGYRDGVRDTKSQANGRLDARYDQGFAKGYAKGREAAISDQGVAGGYKEGYNAGVKAAVDAYEKVIEQAQQIIAAANETPVVTAPPTTALP